LLLLHGTIHLLNNNSHCNLALQLTIIRLPLSAQNETVQNAVFLSKEYAAFFSVRFRAVKSNTD